MDNVLTGTIGCDKVPDFASVQEQTANKPTKFKLGMSGSLGLEINGFKFNSNTVHQGKIVGLRGADSYTTGGQFTSGPTHVLDCELQVVDWGTPSPMKMNPETHEQYYTVEGTKAILTYRVGTCGGGEAYAKTVWDAAMSGELTLTKATWGPGHKGLGAWLWSLEGAVAVAAPVAVPAVEGLGDLEAKVADHEARLTKAGL